MFKIQVSPDNGKKWFDMEKMPKFDDVIQANEWLDVTGGGLLEGYSLLFRVVEIDKAQG